MAMVPTKYQMNITKNTAAEIRFDFVLPQAESPSQSSKASLVTVVGGNNEPPPLPPTQKEGYDRYRPVAKPSSHLHFSTQQQPATALLRPAALSPLGQALTDTFRILGV